MTFGTIHNQAQRHSLKVPSLLWITVHLFSTNLSFFIGKQGEELDQRAKSPKTKVQDSFTSHSQIYMALVSRRQILMECHHQLKEAMRRKDTSQY